MKKAFQVQSGVLLMLLALSSCSPFREIGKVNMISNRNIDTKFEYKQLTTYSGGSRKEIRKSRAKTLEEAIDHVVKSVIGGEFLMNVKIYLIDDKYFAIEGDVWGKGSNEPAAVSVQGFKIGDKITWKRNGKYKTGKVKAFKNNDSCLVETDADNTIIEMNYKDITRVE